MNTTTLNMTTLDGNVIIKKGGGGGVTINNQDKVVDITENGTTEVVADGGFTGLGKVTINTEVSGGGGTELEGEYFLAKPNGRYKKITFINGYVDPSELSEDQLMAVKVIVMLQAYGVCYSGFVCTAGTGNGLNKQNFVEDLIFLASKIGKGEFLWDNSIFDDNYTYDINDGTCFAWEEKDVSLEGLTLSFIDMAQIVLYEILGYEPSLEEVYAFLQIEDVDKADYDEWKIKIGKRTLL